MSALSGVANNGNFAGLNRIGQPIVGQRAAQGQWQGGNPVTGATFEANRLANAAGPTSHWGVTRTGPLGAQQYNDFTLVNRPDGNGGHQVKAYDLNRSGFQPLPNQQPLGSRESFDASITGDPHFKVEGTINGQTVDSAFDNQDLGTRTQYQGSGFQLQTTTVPWGTDTGAAVVDSATVKTGFGKNADAVTVDASGGLLVNGQATTLEEGQTMDLNRTSSVTMQDGSYSVSSRNGKVTNTFTAVENPNGNYLNINSSVDNVQTVGWLQDQA
ncbi:hypothetical protein IV102_21830 [bacterium]|nr:hypothetical protein [bacterium]